MSFTDADLTLPLRNALLGETDITDLLPAYNGSFPIFTRRPVPADAPYPMIVISQDITFSDQDGLNDYRPVITRDIAVYHSNELPANYRLVDEIAQKVRTLLHRQKRNITVPNWTVVEIQASVPIDVDSDRDSFTGRVVMLEVMLAALTEAPDVVIPSHLLLSDGSDLLLTDGGLLKLAGV